MKKLVLPNHPVVLPIILSSLVLFFCSSLRHALYQSNAYDLGIFDNGIYLISQGLEPYVAFRQLHILGDHAAWILYLIALFYKIVPNVHWLFAIQAVALSLGALPTWYLGKNAGLSDKQATTIAWVYLLYPLIFNVNLFDFHPEVIALPLILSAILAAKLNRILGFSIAIIFILGCKAVLSLTVTAMGLWLIFFEKKRRFGAIALFLGITWFMITTQIIFPNLNGEQHFAVGLYSFLGNSVLEIALNIFLKPGIVLSKIFTLANLEYLILLTIPLIWGLSPRHLSPLICTVPILFLNLLAENPQMKNLTQQYALPILPFLILVVISSWVAGDTWLKQQRRILIWSTLAFFALAKYGYFTSNYLSRLDTLPAIREAVSLVNTSGNLLTPEYIAPHLTHRPVVKLAGEGSETIDLKSFQYVLLNVRHPGWASSPEIAQSLVNRLQQNPEFKLQYQRDEVFLFERN